MTESTAPHGNNSPSNKSLLEQLQILVGIILTVIAGYSAWQLNSAEKSLKVTESKLSTRESDRKDIEEIRVNRESLEKKQLMVYEAVVRSLESGDQKRQHVSKALVISMLEDPLRTELLNVLTESGLPEIKKEAQTTLAQENTFKVEQSVIFDRKSDTTPQSIRAAKPEDEKSLIVLGSSTSARTKSKWGDWDFDIFWCEGSGNAAKEQAEKIKQALLDEDAKGRLRVRLLPDSLNARPGYQHTGYVIRYNDNEEEQAKQLMALGDKAIPPGTSFIKKISQQPTAWYLSAFVCPAAH